LLAVRERIPLQATVRLPEMVVVALARWLPAQQVQQLQLAQMVAPVSPTP
jgi:hypothetical protein